MVAVGGAWVGRHTHPFLCARWNLILWSLPGPCIYPWAAVFLALATAKPCLWVSEVRVDVLSDGWHS